MPDGERNLDDEFILDLTPPDLASGTVPEPPAPGLEALDRWSEAVIKKARKNILDEDLIRQVPTRDNMWLVGGTDKIYQVVRSAGDFYTCTCPNGQNIGSAKCYHSAAVHLKTYDL
jgi:hypothetical protein